MFSPSLFSPALYKLTPFDFIVLAAPYICAHDSSGVGSSCNINYLLGTLPVTTFSPTPVPSPTPTPSPSPTPTPTPEPIPQNLSTDTVNTGAIAGGVVGGVAVIALVGVLFFYLRRKRATESAVLTAGGADGHNGQPSPLMGTFSFIFSYRRLSLTNRVV